VTAAVPPVFGYAPGTSWLHRANPLPKLAWLFAAVAIVLVTFDPRILAAILAAGLLLAASSGTGRVTGRTVVALAPVAASIVVIQALTGVACTGSCTAAAAAVGPFVIWQEGLSRGLVLVTRLLALEVVAVPLLATTHPSDLFAALRRMRLPYEIALMASLAIQLVPQLRRELEEVMAAQRARGLRARGIGALAPALVPVVAGAFDRLTTLVLGLEARGLGAGPRTSYRRVDLRGIDVAVAVAGLIAAVVGTWLALVGDQGSAAATRLIVPAPLAVGIVAVAVVVFVAVIARAARGLAGR
jgi:energy-coupling factor transport system permease protein